jgi:DNA polymerase-1
MPTGDELYLVDGTYNVFRAFHARGVPEMRAGDGTPTKATYIFTRMLLSILESKTPRYIGVAFDPEGPTLRHTEYEQYVEAHPEAAADMAGYKATRPETPAELIAQLPWCRKICEGFRIPVLERPGYEADDVIGTLARKGAARGLSVVLVTADKDLFQIVGERIVILNPHKDNLIMDAATVESIFGVRPEQVPDVLALMGDASDNIPVPGIGEKGAKDLVRRFGGLEPLLDRASEVSRKGYREALVAHSPRARLSRELARIRTDAPIELELEALSLSNPDGAMLEQIFSKLEFRSLQGRWGGSVAVPDRVGEAEEKSYRALVSLPEIRDFVREASAGGTVCLDTETTSDRPVEAELVGISLSMRPREAVYVPLKHSYLGAPDQPGWDEVRRLIGPLLGDSGTCKIGHNLKYDMTVLRRAGVEMAGPVFDTMIAAYLVDPSRRAYGLDGLARETIGEGKIPFGTVAGEGRFDAVPVDKAAEYACTDADITLRLAACLKERLKEEQLEHLFETIEMPLVEVLSDMESTGVRVDTDYLNRFSAELSAEMDRISRDVFEIAGHTFNLDSPVQLRKVLFEELGLKPVGRTAKTRAFSTRDEDLEVLATVHALPAKVRDYRTVSKLKSTYVDALPRLVNQRTGRIHASFNQTGAASGRLSSSEPNLQNVPIRTEQGRRVRRAFIPQGGWRLMCADYSQVELRILAHMAEDTALLEAFSSGEDIHRRTAAQIFSVAYDLVSQEQRRVAKTINFGVIYGMGDFRLSRELGIPRKDAKRFIEAYFARYSSVRRYIDETIALVERTGHVRTLLGRIRRFPDVKSSNANTRQQALRAAVNTTIQGTAADLMKKGMINLHRRMKKEGLAARMLIQVHDELVLEAPPAEIDVLQEAVREELEGVHPLRVPLAVEIRVGNNWLEADESC